MFTLKANDKEYKIKFGYKPTLKAGLLHRLAELENNDLEQIESVEKAMLFMPEMILVGLQVFHKDEFGYDYNTNDGYDEQLDKIFDIVDEILNGEDADFEELYNGLQNELISDGFLASLFRKEMAKVEQKNAKKSAKAKTE